MTSRSGCVRTTVIGILICCPLILLLTECLAPSYLELQPVRDTLVGSLRSSASSSYRAGVQPAAPPVTNNSAQLHCDTSAASQLNISDILFGAFFEELSHAGDGGLYAEMVADRRFHWGWDEGGLLTSGPYFPHESTLLPAWNILTSGDVSDSLGRAGSNATYRVADLSDLDRNNPLNPALSCGNPQFNKTCSTASLRLDTSAGSLGAMNTGYWGMHFAPGATYNLTIYARSSSPDSINAIEVQLGSVNSSMVWGSVHISNVGEAWTEFKAQIVVGGAMPETAVGHLSVRPVAADCHTATSSRAAPCQPAAGTLWLGYVSLFPAHTFKGRENGLRADLAQMLVDMKPGFLRFPGGSFVEGETVDTGFWWKRTVGPAVERAGHFNSVWGYRSTGGLGLLEYFQLAEDLGAVPIWVVNVGIAAMQEVPPEGGMGRPGISVFVQDLLDGLQYITGDPDTTEWGRLRAAHGRRAPFAVTHLALGNEDCHYAYYPANYLAFRSAVKKQYPRVKIIANCDLSAEHSMLPSLPGYQRVPLPAGVQELYDSHNYSPAQWFLANQRLYDGYNRSSAHVFISEYSANCAAPVCTSGNLSNAVAEAAWLTGLERNADVVELVAYAPLFVNAASPSWNPNAIHFDSSRVFGTPSYWVSRLFGRNRGSSRLQCVLRSPTGAPVSSNGKARAEAVSLSYSAVQDAAGDLIVKVVNLDASATADLSLGMVGPQQYQEKEPAHIRAFRAVTDLLVSPLLGTRPGVRQQQQASSIKTANAIANVTWTIVTGSSGGVQNSFDDPHAVSEQMHPLEPAVSEEGDAYVQVTLPPLSVSVIRFSAQPSEDMHASSTELQRWY